MDNPNKKPQSSKRVLAVSWLGLIVCVIVLLELSPLMNKSFGFIILLLVVACLALMFLWLIMREFGKDRIVEIKRNRTTMQTLLPEFGIEKKALKSPKSKNRFMSMLKYGAIFAGAFLFDKSMALF